MLRSVLVNDDGWLMNENEPPLTPEILRERMVAPYRDAPVDALLWSVGGGQVYHYETEIGEICGEGYVDLSDADRRQNENVRSITATHGGPLTALADVAHQEGVRLFPSLRMNNHYEVDHDTPGFSRMRREHPEWLIGRGQDLTPNSMEWGIREGLDYAVPQVREYIVSIVCELFERFDVDGVEMDFQRHPGIFRVGEGYASRHLVDDMMAQIRARLDARNRDRERQAELAVRVPETLADSARLGFDVAAWVARGWVDMVIVGGGFAPYDMKIEEFVELARGTPTRVYGCIESLRPAASHETIRGIASRIWASGADGLYFFNYFTRSPEWTRRVLSEIAAPQNMAGLDKRYEIDHVDRVSGPGQIGGAFRHGLPLLQLPAILAPSACGARFRIPVADDPADAACTLRLRLERMGAGDRLEVRVNGTEVPGSSAEVTTEPWEAQNQTIDGVTMRVGWNRSPWYYDEIGDPATLVEMPVPAPPLVRGENRIEVALLRDGDDAAPAILRDVEIDVRFGSATE